jgi:cell division transport system permease protein
MGNLLYFVKEALRGFFRAKLMTFVSIVTIGVTLFFLGVILVGYYNLRLWHQRIASEANVSVYLEDACGPDSAQTILARVAALPAVAAVHLVDKEQAWERFQQLYGSEMLEAVDDNPLPASLEITLAAGHRSTLSQEALRGELEKIGGVENVRFARDWIQQLEKFRNWFSWGTIPVAIILLFALQFMISNTIKLTIYARRDLVTNMHFVGATETYIKMPFILEGMLQGMIGSLFSILALLIARVALARFGIDWGPGYHLYEIIFFIGVVFGCFGSWSAVRKFLV